jgi:site-specific recombinase XerC
MCIAAHAVGILQRHKLVASIDRHLFFTYLVQKGVIPYAPTAKVKRPRRERKPKHVLRLDEFQRMVSVARGSPRDYALLQLLLQTSIRVSELIAIRPSELDLEHQTLTIQGKGSRECIIPLEKKALYALQSYLAVRPKTTDQHLFLNYQGQGLSIAGAPLEENEAESEKQSPECHVGHNMTAGETGSSGSRDDIDQTCRGTRTRHKRLDECI